MFDEYSYNVVFGVRNCFRKKKARARTIITDRPLNVNHDIYGFGVNGSEKKKSLNALTVA